MASGFMDKLRPFIFDVSVIFQLGHQSNPKTFDLLNAKTLQYPSMYLGNTAPQYSGKPRKLKK